MITPKLDPAGGFVQVGDCPPFHSRAFPTHTEFHPGEEPTCQICHPVNHWREAFEELVAYLTDAQTDAFERMASGDGIGLSIAELEGCRILLRDTLRRAESLRDDYLAKLESTEPIAIVKED